MATVIGKIPLTISITTKVGDGAPIEIGTGSLEIEALGKYAVVKAQSGDGPRVSLSVDQAETRRQLAMSLREIADELDTPE